jgi:hypothetical protein
MKTRCKLPEKKPNPIIVIPKETGTGCTVFLMKKLIFTKHIIQHTALWVTQSTPRIFKDIQGGKNCLRLLAKQGKPLLNKLKKTLCIKNSVCTRPDIFLTPLSQAQ